MLWNVLALAALGWLTPSEPQLTWEPLYVPGTARPRSETDPVWTGQELLIWGGIDSNQDGQFLGSGVAYKPSTGAWRSLSEQGAPTARAYQVSTWTGRELAIWGGQDSERFLGDGALYNPVTDSWRPMSRQNAPAGRVEAVGIWSGSEVLVWAGVTDDRSFLDGGLYDPVLNRWRSIPAPDWLSVGPRACGVAKLGEGIVIWGGINGGHLLRSGLVLDLRSASWTRMSEDGAPQKLGYGNLVSVGERLLVVGGSSDLVGSNGAPAPGWWWDQAQGWSPAAQAAPGVARVGGTCIELDRGVMVIGGQHRGERDHPTWVSQAYQLDIEARAWSPLTWKDGPPPALANPLQCRAGDSLLVFGMDPGTFRARGFRVAWQAAAKSD